MSTKYHQNRGWPINGNCGNNNCQLPMTMDRPCHIAFLNSTAQMEFAFSANTSSMMAIFSSFLLTHWEPAFNLVRCINCENGIEHQSAGLTKLPEPGTRRCPSCSARQLSSLLHSSGTTVIVHVFRSLRGKMWYGNRDVIPDCI